MSWEALPSLFCDWRARATVQSARVPPARMSRRVVREGKAAKFLGRLQYIRAERLEDLHHFAATETRPDKQALYKDSFQPYKGALPSWLFCAALKHFFQV